MPHGTGAATLNGARAAADKACFVATSALHSMPSKLNQLLAMCHDAMVSLNFVPASGSATVATEQTD